MSVKKNELKNELGLGTIRQLDPYLSLLGVNVNSSEIDERFADVIRIAHPLVANGMSIQDAVNQAIDQINKAAGSAGNYEETSNRQIDSGLTARNQHMAEMLQQDVLQNATTYQQHYWRMLPIAIHSGAVQNSQSVADARQFAIDAVTGGPSRVDFFSTMVDTMTASNLLTPSPKATLSLCGSTSNETPEEKSSFSSQDNQA